MKILIRTITFLCLTGFVLLFCTKETEPRKIAILNEITDADQSLWTTKNRLFLANATDSLKMGTTVLVYSLKDGKLIKQFGGPEVFKIQPAHSVILFLQPDKLVVNSSDKVSIYNYDFELIQELKHGGDSFFYVPWEDNFIARQIYVEDKIKYYRLNLYDSELNILKELCRKEFSGKAFSGDFSFGIYKDKLYVSGKKDDFIIEVLDKEGNNIKSITHDCSRVKVTQEHKDNHLSNLTSRPGWERFFKSREEMEAYYMNLIKYPEYFPAILSLHFADNRIYVLTRNQVEDKREFWILDLDGHLINKEMVPFKMRSQSMPYPFSIQNNNLYQLILNEQTDQWELYSIAVI
jgi:hypothetical protein